jgi:hypothetical protein
MCYANNSQRYSNDEERWQVTGVVISTGEEVFAQFKKKDPEFSKICANPNTVSIATKQRGTHRRFSNLPQTPKGNSDQNLKIEFLMIVFMK